MNTVRRGIQGNICRHWVSSCLKHRSVSSISGPYREGGVEYLILKNGEKLYEPQEPQMEDCCGKGCSECVWTMYDESKRAYDELVAELKGIPRPLSAFELLELKLAQKQKKRKT